MTRAARPFATWCWPVSPRSGPCRSWATAIRSVFDRYDITTAKDAMETGIHLQRHWERISEEEAQELAEQSAPLKLGEPAVRKDIQTGSVHSSKLLN
jgi:hypothetical protein